MKVRLHIVTTDPAIFYVEREDGRDGEMVDPFGAAQLAKAEGWDVIRVVGQDGTEYESKKLPGG